MPEPDQVECPKVISKVHHSNSPPHRAPWHYHDSMDEPSREASPSAAGPHSHSEELLARVYSELRQLAAARLSQEAPGNTLQATALVHEAYIRLLGPEGRALPWDNDGHFFAAAAEAMRRILIDRARSKGRAKRGGSNYRRVTLDAITLASDEPPDELLDVDAALERLRELDSRKADLVKLRMYAGLSIPQAASALGVSVATAERDWSFARSWLYAELIDHASDPRGERGDTGATDALSSE